MTRPARLALPGLVALGVALGSVAHAEPKAETKASASAETPDQKRARALELFDKSVALFDAGRFGDAATLLEEAYATFPEPVLLYNLARAYQESGELAKSIDAYERFLAADPEVKDRPGIEQRIVTLREQLRATETGANTQVLPPPILASQSTHESKSSPNGAATASVRSDQTATPRPSFVPWIIAGAGAVTIGVGAALGGMASARHASAVDEPS